MTHTTTLQWQAYRVRWVCTCGWASPWGDSGSGTPGAAMVRHLRDTAGE